MEKKLNFVYEKETKNTYRYQEVSEDEELMIKTIYIKKEFFNETRPEKLTVIIKTAE